jgi:hypothetical protein
MRQSGTRWLTGGGIDHSIFMWDYSESVTTTFIHSQHTSSIQSIYYDKVFIYFINYSSTKLYIAADATVDLSLTQSTTIK